MMMLTLLLLSSVVSGYNWGQPSSRSELVSNYLVNSTDSSDWTLVEVFQGNRSHTDHFKLLKEDGMSVLVGARNVIYNISLVDLSEHVHERISWPSTSQDRELCLLKGKSEDDCQNYIRVLARIGPDRLLVCGTNSYSPLCRHYKRHQGEYLVDREFSGKGYAPYDPRHNSTFLYTEGDLYAATVADFSATDSLIIKNQLRTEQYDYKHLNAPDFVSSLQDEDHVYFFFREAAVEYINCGKSIYSRVARVCKKDQGGLHKFRNRWTTFLKSRLNCSVSGEYPFYFNEIQSTSSFYQTENNTLVFYAVFTTPVNSIPGSAICRFSSDDLEDSFEGQFKNQENVYSNWMAMSPSQVPSPRPGRCYNESLKLPETNLHFIKNHCLMDQPVASTPHNPVYIRTGTPERFTRITVDQGVPDIDGVLHDVIYVGTNTGKILKILSNAANPTDTTSKIIEELQLFPIHIPVRNLLIVKQANVNPKLIILSDDEVKALPLYNCDVGHNCEKCVAMKSPYCSWDLVNNKCVHHSPQHDSLTLVQNIEHGVHLSCPIVVDVVTDVPSTSEHDTEMVVTSTEYTEVEDTTLTRETQENLTILPDPLDQTISPIFPTDCPMCECSCPTTIPPSVPIPQQPDQGSLDNQSSYFYEEILDNDVELYRQEKELDIQYGFEDVLPLTETLVEAKSGSHLFSEMTLVVTAVLTGVFSLVIGFLLGLFVSRLGRHDSAASITSSNVSLVKPLPLDKPRDIDTPPISTNNATPTSSTNTSSIDSTTCSTGQNMNKDIKILVNIPPKTGPVKTARTIMNCTGTLQKVKRVYL